MKQIIRRIAALVVGLGLGAVALAGLESVTHISDLNASWPLGSDLASTSDDHIRNIKTALKTDFPNINAAVTATPAQLNTTLDLTASGSNLTASGTLTASSFIPTSSTVPANGIYLPAANTLGFASNSTKWGSVNSTGNWVTVAPTSGTAFVLNAISNSRALDISDGTQTFDISTDGSHNYYIGPTGAVSLNLQTGSLGTTRMSVGASGNVTVNAPSSGVALTVAAVSGTHSTKIADSANNSFNAGFLEIPFNGQSGNYTLVLSDSGKSIYHASGDGSGDTYTIPANGSVAYPTGTVLTFINSDSNSVSIAITTDTMTLCGTTTTGTRTLAQNGEANAIKVTSTSWIICGTGLT
jgi:hypothetical protein